MNFITELIPPHPEMDGWGMALTQRNATEVFPTTVQKGF